VSSPGSPRDAGYVRSGQKQPTQTDPRRVVPLGSSRQDAAKAAADSRPPKERDAEEQRGVARQSISRALAGGRANSVYVPKELSWEQYDALSPQQRAAVDANTAISGAVKADVAKGETTSDAEYDGRIKKLFGSGPGAGGSVVAPETVSVLEQLGIKSKYGDLDNYLNGQALATEADLATIGGGNRLGTRAAAMDDYGKATLSAVPKALEAGQSLLDRARGATPSAAYNPASEESQALSQLYDFLGRNDLAEPVTDAELGTWLQGLSSEFPGLDTNTIYNYFDTRLKQADYAATGIGSGDASYMSSAEFRQRYFGG